MRFIDSTVIHVRSGRGGDGIVSFASAKGRPKLGPDGGDGGEGGHVDLVADRGLNTLSALRYKQRYNAAAGTRGGANDRTGANGATLKVKVPIGTIILDAETGVQVGELLSDQQAIRVATGGRRGRGNKRWLTSTNQAPEQHSRGGDGQDRTLQLELKLLANVGLAGLPNAGKSTLLSALTSAKPKVADYPFTTTIPQLGVVEMDGSSRQWGPQLVMADIPGLIAGASQGRGMGLRFLRHLERTQLIAYVIDGLTENPDSPHHALDQLRAELSCYDEQLEVGDRLSRRPSLIIINKIDAMTPDQIAAMKVAMAQQQREVMFVSAATGQGLDALKHRIYELVYDSERAAAIGQPPVDPLEANPLQVERLQVDSPSLIRL